MRRLGFALFVCLIASTAKADSILAANCAVTAALCADTPSLSGELAFQSFATFSHDGGGYNSGPVTNASDTFTDPTFGTSSATLAVAYDGIHGSSSVTPKNAGGVTAEFNGQIIDFFQIAGSLPTGAQLEVTYGADVLSNAALSGVQGYVSYHQINLNLNNDTCILDLYGSGDLTKSCNSFVTINPQDHTAEVILQFGAGLTSEYSGSGSAVSNTTYLNATNTAKIDGITVVDSRGNPVSGVQVYDASGYGYNAPASRAAAPEPSSLFLLGTGLATMAGVARRRIDRFAMPVL